MFTYVRKINNTRDDWEVCRLLPENGDITILKHFRNAPLTKMFISS